MANNPMSLASVHGLSEEDAQARLKTEGYNELPRPNRRTPLRIVLEVLREPMLALLLGGGAIYLALGDLKEAIILLVFATMSVLITVFREFAEAACTQRLRFALFPPIRRANRASVSGGVIQNMPEFGRLYEGPPQ